MVQYSIRFEMEKNHYSHSTIKMVKVLFMYLTHYMEWMQTSDAFD